MGVIGNQLARKYFEVTNDDLGDFLTEVQALAKKHKIDVALVIQAAEILEQRRATNTRVQAGDYWDEQIGGLNETLQSLADALQRDE